MSLAQYPQVDNSQDVNFPEATLSGYLSISHLTDAHPHLTTFFTGEIVGPKNGFITGSRFGATEHDDMRHWGRFEQFRRPSTRAVMIRPELLFRDPLPDRSSIETSSKERDFVFLRIKERFLVPDHTVRDISGASFAGQQPYYPFKALVDRNSGFYYAMVDFAPNVQTLDAPIIAISPITPKSPQTPTSPTVARRTSSGEAVSPSRPDGLRRSRESSGKLGDDKELRGEATIRGVSVIRIVPGRFTEQRVLISVLFPFLGQSGCSCQCNQTNEVSDTEPGAFSGAFSHSCPDPEQGDIRAAVNVQKQESEKRSLCHIFCMRRGTADMKMSGSGQSCRKHGRRDCYTLYDEAQIDITRPREHELK